MVNTNIQGVIPLAGHGHAPGFPYNYVPGEFSKLVNLEINNEGSLVSRRNIKNMGGDSPSEGVLTEPYGFVGSVASSSVVLSKGQLLVNVANGGGNTYQYWNPADYAGKIKHVFSYNNHVHTVGYRKVQNTSTGVWDSYLDILKGPNTLGAATATSYSALTKHLGVVSFNTIIPFFRQAFMYKERLWVLFNDQIMFSKATDPTVFTVPDGGFFKIHSTGLNFALGTKNGIYIFSDSSIHLLSYSSDPNLDATLTTITTNIGADTATVHNDTVYFVKHDSLYALSGLNVTKVLELKLQEARCVSKVVSFGDYIVLLRQAVSGQEVLETSPARPNYDNWYLNQPNVIFINMTTGSIHAVDFEDTIDTSQVGYISDMMYVPAENLDESSTLQFMTSSKLNSATSKGFVYYMNMEETQFDAPTFDRYINSSLAAVDREHLINFEVTQYVPDGFEYAMKKFRSLMIQGVFPSNGSLELQIFYDNQPPDKVTKHTIKTSEHISFASREPYPLRFPLNQRARSITIALMTDKAKMGAGGYDSFINIQDMRVLWSYTSRMPIDRDQNANNLS